MNDLGKWSFVKIYMCNWKGDVVCLSRNEFKVITKDLVRGICFLGVGVGGERLLVIRLFFQLMVLHGVFFSCG